MVNQTLLDYLTAADPVTNDSNCKNGSNSMSHDWVWPVEIKEWQDFELEDIYRRNNDLRQVLEQSFDLEDESEINPIAFCNHWKEACVTSTIIKWNQTVVLKALQVAQEALATEEVYDAIYMLSGTQALPPPGKRSHPDWASVIEPTRIGQEVTVNAETSTSILPGETKVAKKWCSERIVDGPVVSVFEDAESQFATLTEWYKHWYPLRQILHYCYLLNTKYGYLLTNREIVVFRISKSDKRRGEGENVETVPENSQDAYTPLDSENPQLGKDFPLCMEYKAIPWNTTKGHDRPHGRIWTINLALFILHMLAKDDHKIVSSNTSFGASSTGRDSPIHTRSFTSNSTTSSLRRPFAETNLNGEARDNVSVNGNTLKRNLRSHAGPEKKAKTST